LLLKNYELLSFGRHWLAFWIFKIKIQFIIESSASTTFTNDNNSDSLAFHDSQLNIDPLNNIL